MYKKPVDWLFKNCVISRGFSTGLGVLFLKPVHKLGLSSLFPWFLLIVLHAWDWLITTLGNMFYTFYTGFIIKITVLKTNNIKGGL